jgi:hypothetical protein
MKVFGLMIILSFGIFASNAQADTCRAFLKNQQGYTIETFYANGYNRPDACQLASQICHRALRNGPYQGRYLRCEVEGSHNPGNITRSCNVSLEDRYGRIVRGFSGHARGRTHQEAYQNACRTGLRDCHFFSNRYGYYNYTCRVRRY